MFTTPRSSSGVTLLRRTVAAFAVAAVCLASPAVFANPASGAHLFSRYCAPCHGSSGGRTGFLQGAPPRNFHDPAWRQTHSAREIFNAIRDGAAGTTMPSWRRLSDRDISDLVGFILSLPEGPSEPRQDEESGLTRSNCADPNHRVTRVTPSRERGHPDASHCASTLEIQG